MKNKQIQKKVVIKTYGCQMNLRDSEVIAGLLQVAGFKIIDAPEKADVVIFNTCSVRQHAEDKVWSEVGRICKGTRQGGRKDAKCKPIVGIVGCMAQNYKELVFQRSSLVDFVVGPSDIDKIPGIIKKITSFEKLGAAKSPGLQVTGKSLFETRIWETEGELRPDKIYHTGFYEEKEHAFVVISEGCSNYCSYCVVPYVRGNLRHRDYKAILKEIKGALDKGITKITLLGQNVNAYQSGVQKEIASQKALAMTDKVNFIELLNKVNQIKGLKEFSFITSHPKDASIDFFKSMAELEKLKKYLHLPVQSGSDRILKLMNRNYTRKYYLDLADNYRKIVKKGVLTTDIIVGYPTETEEDFKDTYNLVKEVEFNAGFIFKYSVRPHTAAAKMPDDVSKEEKERRHSLILELQKEISILRQRCRVDGERSRTIKKSK